jgi:hypothetical protein
MARHTDHEFVEDLLSELDLNPNQKISTLLGALEDDDDDDPDEE